MNGSCIQALPIANIVNIPIPPVVEHLGHEVVKAIAFLLIPAELLYFSIYFHAKGCRRIYQTLTFLSLATFSIAPYAAPISCGPAQCLQKLTSRPF